MALEAEELEYPDFLENTTEEDYHEKMLSNYPNEIDKTEGGFLWDVLRPVSIELSELTEFRFMELLKCLFPATCEESYLLDYHAARRNMQRRESEPATGYVDVVAEPGTVIPINYIFSTESGDEGDTVTFFTTIEVVINDSGKASIPVEAEEGGTQGNVAIGSVVLQVGDEYGNIIDSITEVNNSTAMTGGLDEESDDDLRERLDDYDKNQDKSYAGTPSDYKRWAMSVAGVGNATVISAKDTSGIVTIVVTDQSGQPASKVICDAVYNYIMSPDDPSSRLAPCGAFLVVQSPDSIKIGVSAKIYITDTTKLAVTEAFKVKMQSYLYNVTNTDHIVRKSKLQALLNDITGVYDIEDFILIESGSQVPGNITVDEKIVPVIGDIAFTEG